MESYLKEGKFYVPDISEFHVGFEFETSYPLMQGSLDNWKKVTLELHTNDDFWSLYEGDAIPSEFRVKHLDREDIESLGFKVTTEPYRWQFTKDNYMLITGTYTSKEDVPKDIISIGDQRYDDTIFRGTIKNKSELKRLLKQLGI